MCEVLIEDPLQCRGHTTIPDTWQELVERRIDDDWNTNIKCVINGTKHVAVTDYDSITDPEEVERYYEMLGGMQEHIELVEKAKECGVGLLIDDEGTHYYFRPDAEINAKLLMKYGFVDKGDLPKDINREIFRSLLMGYTDLSIILYQVVNEQDQAEGEGQDFLDDDNYEDTVREFIQGYTPQIEKAREYIRELGGVMFDD